MENLSLSSGKDYETLAKIIKNEHFDIVALQEILSEGKAIEYFLLGYLGKQWNIIWEKPSAYNGASHDRRGEGFAYLWNTTKFKKAEFLSPKGKKVFEPRIINSKGRDISKDCTIFSRIPYYARFEPIRSGYFEIRLVNVHLHYGDNTTNEIYKRQMEFNFLTEHVYPAISDIRYGTFRQAYTVILGDYNLNISRPRGIAEKDIKAQTYLKELVYIPNGNKQRCVQTVQDQLTTLKDPQKVDPNRKDSNRHYHQNYDHFSFDIAHFTDNNVQYQYGRIDAVDKYCNGNYSIYSEKISDHLPIVLDLEFSTNSYMASATENT